MPMEEEPVVGKTYQDPDGLAFEILAFDEDDGTIEIEYTDGTVDEIDLDTWYEMDLRQLKTAAKPDADAVDDEEEEEEEKKPKVDKDEDDDDDFEDYDEDGDIDDE